MSERIDIHIEVEYDLEDEDVAQLTKLFETIVVGRCTYSDYQFGTLEHIVQHKLQGSLDKLERMICHAVWEYIGDYVWVGINITYVERTPSEFTEWDQEDYAEWKAKGPIDK